MKRELLYVLLIVLICACTNGSSQESVIQSETELDQIDSSIVIDESGRTSNGVAFSKINDVCFVLDHVYYLIYGSCLTVCGLDNEEGIEYVKIYGSINIANKCFTTTIIASTSFRDRFKMKRIDIPNTIKLIEEYAFSGSGLERISLPESIDYIPIGCFSNCSNLTDVTIPYSVKVIGKWAFLGCSSLRDVYIPHNVERIGSAAFGGREDKPLTIMLGTIPNGDEIMEFAGESYIVPIANYEIDTLYMTLENYLHVRRPWSLFKNIKVFYPADGENR